IKIIQTHHERQGKKPQTLINAILETKHLEDYKQKTQAVLVEEKIIKYIAQLVNKTRNHPHLYLGGSPRASLAILNTAKAFAAINGRDFVIPEDVKKALKPVLNHRIILTPEREMEGMTTENVIDMIEQSVEVPR
ncbi:MAG: magnesium chelatase, partial [Bizionia sp.]|nr:magnesium chelatase [Bizionia sp.]